MKGLKMRFNDREWYDKNGVPPMIEEDEEMARKPLKKAQKRKLRQEQGKPLIANTPSNGRR